MTLMLLNCLPAVRIVVVVVGRGRAAVLVVVGRRGPAVFEVVRGRSVRVWVAVVALLRRWGLATVPRRRRELLLLLLRWHP